MIEDRVLAEVQRVFSLKVELYDKYRQFLQQLNDQGISMKDWVEMVEEDKDYRNNLVDRARKECDIKNNPA